MNLENLPELPRFTRESVIVRSCQFEDGPIGYQILLLPETLEEFILRHNQQHHENYEESCGPRQVSLVEYELVTLERVGVWLN